MISILKFFKMIWQQLWQSVVLFVVFSIIPIKLMKISLPIKKKQVQNSRNFVWFKTYKLGGTVCTLCWQRQVKFFFPLAVLLVSSKKPCFFQYSLWKNYHTSNQLYISNQSILSKHKAKSLTDAELQIVKEMVAVLKPFHIITKRMSGEKYPILSRVLPSIEFLRDNVKVKESDSYAVSKLKESLISSMEDYFSK